MFFIDRSLYSSWDYILKNSIDPAFLMETFTVTHNNKLDELKPGGAEILIDDDNKKEYIDLAINYYTNVVCMPFLKQILNEIFRVIPK